MRAVAIKPPYLAPCSGSSIPFITPYIHPSVMIVMALLDVRDSEISLPGLYQTGIVTSDTLDHVSHKAVAPSRPLPHSVRLPNLFSDIMASEYAINPFYSSVKPKADAWIEEYVSNVQSEVRSYHLGTNLTTYPPPACFSLTRRPPKHTRKLTFVS